MSAPLPLNEAERLETLRQYAVLDTLPEEAFDDLTMLAAHICQVPSAMVSLVDQDRQWFKSKIGMPFAQTPRASAFCAHTILHSDTIMEIHDAQQDPRFADSPLVTSAPNIRFYAGAPLVAPDGQAIGALCVTDRVPRTLSPEQLNALRALSRRVVSQLELRRHLKRLSTGEQESRRQLAVAEKSRRALLSLLEDQKMADAALRTSEERFRQVVESIHEVFWMSDIEKHRVLYISPAYEKIWGRSCESLYASSLSWAEAIHENDRERVMQSARTKQITGEYNEVFRIVRPDGEIRWVRARSFPIREGSGPVRRVVGVAEDITERKQLEEQFLRAQRLESIGMLATGIAHDLNNILAPISISAPLLRDSLSEPGDLRILSMLEGCAQRGTSLVRQILGFAKGVGGEPQLIQIKHLLHDITGVIRETFPKSIALQENFPTSLWPVIAHPTHLHQVLLNLCVNARDAMPDGGSLLLRAENLQLDEISAQAIEGARPGAWLVLHVEDTGTGIPPEVVARMWEPFFTTKTAERGTGLGLATVRGIAHSHGGFITLQTEVGRGTTFRVYLPAADTPNDQDRRSIPPLPRAGRNEIILLAEDEQPIRESAAAILTNWGYRVISAANGTEAAILFEKRSDEISLVITDDDMPGIDGAQLVQFIRARKPAMKIILTSGGRPPKPVGTHAAPAFLSKPFTVETLMDGVGQQLGSALPKP